MIINSRAESCGAHVQCSGKIFDGGRSGNKPLPIMPSSISARQKDSIENDEKKTLARSTSNTPAPQIDCDPTGPRRFFNAAVLKDLALPKQILSSAKNMKTTDFGREDNSHS